MDSRSWVSVFWIKDFFLIFSTNTTLTFLECCDAHLRCLLERFFSLSTFRLAVGAEKLLDVAPIAFRSKCGYTPKGCKRGATEARGRPHPRPRGTHGPRPPLSPGGPPPAHLQALSIIYLNTDFLNFLDFSELGRTSAFSSCFRTPTHNSQQLPNMQKEDKIT